MRKLGVHSVAAAATLASAVIFGIEPVAAGGSRLAPVRDRYEAGETATLVGYTGGRLLGANPAAGPYRAFLEGESGSFRVEVSPLQLSDRGARGWDALRVVAQFRIPHDVAAGHYSLSYCTDGCTSPAQLGDLIGGYLSVGVDPPVTAPRVWPIDEPEIANLADDAVLTGPGYQTTAAEVRAGRAPTPSVPSAPPAAASAPAITAPAVTAPAVTAPAPVAEAGELAQTPQAPAAPNTPWALVLGLGVAAAGAGAGIVRRRSVPTAPNPPTASSDTRATIGSGAHR